MSNREQAAGCRCSRQGRRAIRRGFQARTPKARRAAPKERVRGSPTIRRAARPWPGAPWPSNIPPSSRGVTASPTADRAAVIAPPSSPKSSRLDSVALASASPKPAIRQACQRRPCARPVHSPTAVERHPPLSSAQCAQALSASPTARLASACRASRQSSEGLQRLAHDRPSSDRLSSEGRQRLAHGPSDVRLSERPQVERRPPAPRPSRPAVEHPANRAKGHQRRASAGDRASRAHRQTGPRRHVTMDV